MGLNEKIKKYRKACGMNQITFAERMSVSQSTVASWESGSRIPDINAIMVMADMFGTTTDELLCRSSSVIARHDTQALTEEEQELLKLWRSADQTSHMYAISVLKTKNSIYEERGIS